MKERLDRLIRWLKHKLHRCAEEGCWTKGNECCLPCPDPDGAAEVEWVCGEHAHRLGYCRSCGQFLGGIESFEFNKSGLCDNCEEQWKADCGEFDEPDFDFQ